MAVPTLGNYLPYAFPHTEWENIDHNKGLRWILSPQGEKHVMCKQHKVISCNLGKSVWYLN